MPTYTAPTTRASGFLVTASVWNTDIVENIKYFKDAPVFDTAAILGAATTSGIRLDLESGVLAVREGDDSAYGPMRALTLQALSSGTIPSAQTDSTQQATFGAFDGASDGSVGIFGGNRGILILGTNQVAGTTLSDAGKIVFVSGLRSQTAENTGAIAKIGVNTTATGATTGADMTFSTRPTSGSLTERMRIDSSGNVGIGGTPGSVRLDLIGALNAIRVSDVTTDATTKQGKWLQRHYTNAEEDVMVAFTLSTSTANQILIGGGSGAQNAATAISFFTAANNTTTSGTETFRISSGNIAIGATARLYLDGVAGTGDTYIEEYAANEVRLTVGGAAHSAFNATGQFVYYNPPTTASAANAYIAQTDYIRRSTSSIRYKHDIATLDTTDALSAVMAMRPVTYRGKTDDDQRRFVGFIAEEMAEIAPLLATYDEGGESGTPNYVTYDRVTAYLVAVVQQQQQKIAALEARIH